VDDLQEDDEWRAEGEEREHGCVGNQRRVHRGRGRRRGGHGAVAGGSGGRSGLRHGWRSRPLDLRCERCLMSGRGKGVPLDSGKGKSNYSRGNFVKNESVHWSKPVKSAPLIKSGFGDSSAKTTHFLKDELEGDTHLSPVCFFSHRLNFRD
jgi:hypothetical protein